MHKLQRSIKLNLNPTPYCISHVYMFCIFNKSCVVIQDNRRSQHTFLPLHISAFLCRLYVHVYPCLTVCPPSLAVPGDRSERVPREGPAGCVPHQGQQGPGGVSAGHGARK